jgi:hypothetical protein
MPGATASSRGAASAAPEVERLCRVLEALILCVAAAFVLFGTYARSFGDTANSRLATVYSLVKYGTFYIDPVDGIPNRFEQATIDKVVADGHMLSSKPPILPLLMTAEYLVLHAVLGWDLESPEDTNEIIRAMSLGLVGFPYLAALFLFARMLRWFFSDPLSRVVLLGSLAFCTQLWGYSTNLNNHEPGAALVVASLYVGLGILTVNLAATWWRFFLFGLSSALVFTIDMPVTIFCVPVALCLLYKHPVLAVTAALAGGLIPIGIHSGVMYACTGSPLPVQTNNEFYHYETSFWRHPIGIDCLNEPKGTYLFNMTLGRCGLFSLFPVLFVGIAAAIRALVRAEMAHRAYVLIGAACFMVLSAYYCKSTNNYGGEAYGFRWYIGAMPVLLLMGGGIVESLRQRWQWIFLGLMIGISFYSAWECTVTPWQSNTAWAVRFLGRGY